MKKLFWTAVVVLVLSSSSLAGRFLVSAEVSYLSPSDSGFKDIYGSSVILPELRVGITIFKDFFIYGSYGFFSVKGETPVLKFEAKSAQNVISFGAGYSLSLTRAVSLEGAVGGVFFDYKEEALDTEVKGSALGFRVEGGAAYTIGKHFFARLSAAYLAASDTVEGVDIKLGGFRAGIGLGVSF
jgi:hypothetical protein